MPSVAMMIFQLENLSLLHLTDLTNANTTNSK